MLEMTAGDRRQLAENIRTRIDRGDEVVWVIYEPGDGTHYEMVLSRIDRHPPVWASVFGAERLHAVHERERWVMADAGAGFRAMTVDLSPGHYTDPSYVLEKWRSTMGSAVVVAELLNMVNMLDPERMDAFRQAYPAVFAAVPA